MARNAEIIRQWEILRAIDATPTGLSVARLAAEREVHPRTIKRDLEALCGAGFPLYDDKVNGTPMWKLGARPFRHLEHTGLGIAELAGLYFGHVVLTTAAGAAFENDGERALMKINRALPPASRPLNCSCICDGPGWPECRKGKSTFFDRHSRHPWRSQAPIGHEAAA